MATRYRNAPEVEEIARKLIREHHRHLMNVEIKYVFADKPTRRAGKETWATARKVGSLNAFLAGLEDEGDQMFVITVTEPIWSYLPPEKREALIDHELCHCWVDLDSETPRLILVGHDLEEFVQVIHRHGLWRDEVQKFVEVGSPHLQDSLFDSEPAAGTESTGDREANKDKSALERRGLVLAGPPRR